jgi:hypothetical protein
VILFLLYREPIYRFSNPQGWFGYADDTGILCIGNTVEETAAAASRSVEELVRWGAANGVSFDPKKTEVMHFSRSKLKTAPAIRHGDIEKHPETAMRWLGIWLDTRTTSPPATAQAALDLPRSLMLKLQEHWRALRPP